MYYPSIYGVLHALKQPGKEKYEKQNKQSQATKPTWRTSRITFILTYDNIKMGK